MRTRLVLSVRSVLIPGVMRVLRFYSGVASTQVGLLETACLSGAVVLLP